MGFKLHGIVVIAVAFRVNTPPFQSVAAHDDFFKQKIPQIILRDFGFI